MYPEGHSRHLEPGTGTAQWPRPVRRQEPERAGHALVASCRSGFDGDTVILIVHMICGGIMILVIGYRTGVKGELVTNGY
jgi:hypothetical protein